MQFARQHSGGTVGAYCHKHLLAPARSAPSANHKHAQPLAPAAAGDLQQGVLDRVAIGPLVELRAWGMHVECVTTLLAAVEAALAKPAGWALGARLQEAQGRRLPHSACSAHIASDVAVLIVCHAHSNAICRPCSYLNDRELGGELLQGALGLRIQEKGQHEGGVGTCKLLYGPFKRSKRAGATGTHARRLLDHTLAHLGAVGAAAAQGRGRGRGEWAEGGWSATVQGAAPQPLMPCRSQDSVPIAIMWQGLALGRCKL